MGEIVPFNVTRKVKSLEQEVKSELMRFSEFTDYPAFYRETRFQGHKIQAICADGFCSSDAIEIFTKKLKHKIIKNADDWQFLVDDSTSSPNSKYFTRFAQCFSISVSNPFVNPLSREIITESCFESHMAAYAVLTNNLFWKTKEINKNYSIIKKILPNLDHLMALNDIINTAIKKECVNNDYIIHFFSEYLKYMYMVSISESYMNVTDKLSSSQKENIFVFCKPTNIELFDDGYEPDLEIPEHVLNANYIFIKSLYHEFIKSKNPDNIAIGIDFAKALGEPLNEALAKKKMCKTLLKSDDPQDIELAGIYAIEIGDRKKAHEAFRRAKAEYLKMGLTEEANECIEHIASLGNLS